MFKSAIEPLYQTLFNYFVKKDGYNSIVPFFTGFALFATFIFALGSLALLINLFFNNVLISKYSNKGIILFGIIVFAILNHLFLFNILKLEKEGDFDDHLFRIEPKQYKRNLRIIFSPIFSFFVISIISLTIQSLQELEN